MGAEEILTNTSGKTAEPKVAPLAVTAGVAETVKEAAQAEKALERAMDINRTEEERLAANQAASIHGRRAMLKAFSTILSQIPGEGTALSTVVESANSVLDKVVGDPEKLEKQASQNSLNKRQSTESFMQEIREQAATEKTVENSQTNGIRQ